jgi:hypothetical protein
MEFTYAMTCDYKHSEILADICVHISAHKGRSRRHWVLDPTNVDVNTMSAKKLHGKMMMIMIHQSVSNEWELSQNAPIQKGNILLLHAAFAVAGATVRRFD